MSARLRVALAVFLASGGGAGAWAAPSVEVLGATSEGLSLRVVPSAADIARALGPDGRRTTGFLVALPPGSRPLLGDVDASRSRIDAGAPAAASLPERPVRLGERARAGGLELLRIEVAPVTLAPGGGGADLNREIRVELFFRDGVDSISGPVEGARTRKPGRRGDRDPAAAGRQGSGRSDPVREAVLAVAVNGSQARRFPEQEAPVPAPPDFGDVPGSCSSCLKVEVEEDGLYRLRYDDLQGLPAYEGGDPRELHVFHRGEEIAVEVDGERDGSFDPGDQIVFLGARNRDRFGDTSVYWILPPDGTPGRRMPVRAAFSYGDEDLPAVSVVRGVVRFEYQVEHYGKMPDPEGKDPWMAAFLGSNGLNTAAADLPPSGAGEDAPDLASPVPGESYRLRARFVARAGPVADEQLISFHLNGVAVGFAGWRASETLDHVVDLSFNPQVVAAMDNHMRVLQPPPPDPSEWRLNYVDWVEIGYPRRLIAHDGRIDFSHAATAGAVYYVGGFSESAPRLYAFEDGNGTRLVGPRVLSLGPGMPKTLVFAWHGAGADVRVLGAEAGAIRSPARITLDTPSSLRSLPGAEYLVISHPRFLGEAQSLAAYRGGIAVSLTDVYDEFSHGMEDSTVVRDFLRMTLSWPTRPRFVALVGDASFDYRNYQGLADPAYEPPSLLHARDVYLESVSGLRAASDTWFAAVLGADFVPDLAIGRIPVRTPGALDAYLRKLQQYDAQPPSGWMAKIQLFADDDVANNRSECGIPGTIADDFEENVGRFLSGAAPANLLRRFAGSYTGVFAPQDLRADIVSDLSSGVGIQIYAGHGNRVTMGRHCQAGSFSILEPQTLALLSDQQPYAYPLGVAMTCDVGEFDFAAEIDAKVETQALAEQYLLAADRGHIAWLATTAVLLYSTGAELSDALFSALYENGGPDRRVVGEVALEVMLQHFAERGEGARDALETLVVLGDPAITLRAERP